MDRSAIVDLDKRYVWHPYTSMELYRREVDPIVVVRSEGSYFYDADGRRYLDGNGSWWVSTVGHRHPRLVEAARRQLDSLAHVSLAGCTHEPAARLAEELVTIAPCAERDVSSEDRLAHVFYSDNGSTAVEVALKMCAQYWAQNGAPRRRVFLSLQGAFHGETTGATSVGGIAAFREIFRPWLFEVVHLPTPDSVDGGAGTLAALEAVLAARGDEIAGVIVEPRIQGAIGMRIHAPSLLAAVRTATRRCGVFLIADEVFTGLGRTGATFACDTAAIVPDVLCLAKSLSGGILPFAATLATRRLFDGFLGDRSRALLYGHSYCGNPLGAAVAREVLRVHEEEHIVDRVRQREPRVREAFEAIAAKHSVACNGRACGLVGAIDLGGGGYLGEAGWRVYAQALARGVYLRPLGDTIYIAPALNIDDGALDTLLHAVADSVDAALAEATP